MTRTGGSGEQVKRPGPLCSAPQPGPSEGASPTAGDGSQAGGRRSSAGQARASRRAALRSGLPRPPSRLPASCAAPAAAQLPVVATAHLANRFSTSGPPLTSAAQQPSPSQLLSLPDWLSRDLMPISQSPPLSRPRLASERLAAAPGAGSGAAGRRRVCSPTRPATFPGLCAHARAPVRGVCFLVYRALSR